MRSSYAPMKKRGSRDSTMTPITVKMIAPSIVPSYMMMDMGGIESIGFPPVTSG